MNHCIQGGIGGGDGGEERRAAPAPAVAWGTPPAPPASMGVRRPLAPFLHAFLGALPHGDGIHGGGKNMALVAANSWVWVLGHDLGFPTLYGLSDFHLGLQWDGDIWSIRTRIGPNF